MCESNNVIGHTAELTVLTNQSNYVVHGHKVYRDLLAWFSLDQKKKEKKQTNKKPLRADCMSSP